MSKLVAFGTGMIVGPILIAVTAVFVKPAREIVVKGFTELVKLGMQQSPDGGEEALKNVADAIYEFKGWPKPSQK